MFRSKKGFTLVELLAVIVILAIILAIAVPGISGVISSSRESAFESDARLIISGIEYKILEYQAGASVDMPTEDAAPITDSTGLQELADYGANPDNYSSFQIIQLEPTIKIKLTSKADSEFGAFTATVTKAGIIQE